MRPLPLSYRIERKSSHNSRAQRAKKSPRSHSPLRHTVYGGPLGHHHCSGAFFKSRSHHLEQEEFFWNSFSAVPALIFKAWRSTVATSALPLTLGKETLALLHLNADLHRWKKGDLICSWSRDAIRSTKTSLVLDKPCTTFIRDL